MQQPIEITILDIPHSDAVEEHIRDLADKLNLFSDNIISCHVVVRLMQKNQQTGRLHNVRITVGVPGKTFVANHNPHENLYTAITLAFDDMNRQLKHHMQRIHGKVKSHPELLLGKVVRLMEDGDFGFIEAADGAEYYFNASNLTSPKHFADLKVGMEVHFIEAMADDGPQANRVSLKRLQS